MQIKILDYNLPKHSLGSWWFLPDPKERLNIILICIMATNLQHNLCFLRTPGAAQPIQVNLTKTRHKGCITFPRDWYSMSNSCIPNTAWLLIKSSLFHFQLYCCRATLLRHSVPHKMPVSGWQWNQLKMAERCNLVLVCHLLLKSKREQLFSQQQAEALR